MTRSAIGRLRPWPVLSLALLCAAAVCSTEGTAAQVDPKVPLVSQRYRPSSENFANPERGFYQQEELLPLGKGRSPLDPAKLKRLRSEGVSTLRLYLLIDEFRSAPLSEDVLTYLRAEFGKVRNAGLKIIPRVAYAYPSGGTYPYKEPDAPLGRVLEHIEQLQPLLRENADIISFMEAGFVGAWGEWHSSTNKLVNPEPNTAVNDASKAIVTRLLEALPKSRMIALRYPRYKQQLFGEAALKLSEAFSGSNRARVGAHDDCFLASSDNWGTFSENKAAREAMKTYLQGDNRFVPQGGETCNADADAQPFIGCANAVQEMKRAHYTALNRDYHLDVYARWQKDGCLDDVKRSLGYRFSLLESSMPAALRPGEAFTFKLSVKNEGYATPFNPRGVALVLRNVSSGKLHRLSITDGTGLPGNRALDPRFWTAGETSALSTTLPLPADLEPGKYDVLLHLYDPQAKLKDRPEYAIQLANQGVWEAKSGMNKLRTVEIRR